MLHMVVLVGIPFIFLPFKLLAVILSFFMSNTCGGANKYFSMKTLIFTNFYLLVKQLIPLKMYLSVYRKLPLLNTYCNNI